MHRYKLSIYHILHVVHKHKVHIQSLFFLLDQLFPYSVIPFSWSNWNITLYYLVPVGSIGFKYNILYYVVVIQLTLMGWDPSFPFNVLISSVY